MGVPLGEPPQNMHIISIFTGIFDAWSLDRPMRVLRTLMCSQIEGRARAYSRAAPAQRPAPGYVAP